MHNALAQNGSTELLVTAPAVTVFEVVHAPEYVDEVAAAMQNCDCILFEWLGGSPQERQFETDVINAITAGQYTDEELANAMTETHSFVHDVAHALRSSEILFLPIDTSNDTNSKAWRMHQIELSAEQSAAELLEHDPNNIRALRSLLRYRAAQVSADMAREEHMAADIEKHLGRIAKHPRLSGQIHHVGVLVGRAHGAIYEDLHNKLPEVNRKLIPASLAGF
jgi:hypothetical protein